MIFSKGKGKHFDDFRCELFINKYKAGPHVHVNNDAYLWNIDTLFKFCVFREMYQVCTYNNVWMFCMIFSLYSDMFILIHFMTM